MDKPFKIVVVVEEYGGNYQTFVDYHVANLSADVMCYHSDEDINDPEKSGMQVCSRGHVSKETLLYKIFRRSREVLFGLEIESITPDDKRCFSDFLRKKEVKVLLIEFAPMAIAAMKSGLLDNVPFVVHFHGYDASSMLRFPSYVKDLTQLFDKASAIVVVSEYMKQTLLSLGCNESKLAVIPCGANIEKISVATPSEDRCVFLTASRLIESKGLMETLKAFEVCAEKQDNIQLNIIGDGPLSDKLQKLIVKKSLTEQVRLLGHLSHKQVLSYMTNSDVFLQHSKTSSIGWVEGWGVSLAEAAAAALPVISTRHGGIPDQVIDGVTGYLIDEGDWQSMAEKMLCLGQNPKERIRLGKNGRENILKVGNARIQVEKLRRVLEQALVSYEKCR